jgi:uncharacterized membrane protein
MPIIIIIIIIIIVIIIIIMMLVTVRTRTPRRYQLAMRMVQLNQKSALERWRQGGQTRQCATE